MRRILFLLVTTTAACTGATTVDEAQFNVNQLTPDQLDDSLSTKTLAEQGAENQGRKLEGHSGGLTVLAKYARPMLRGDKVNNLHIERGELVGEVLGQTKRGSELIGTFLAGYAKSGNSGSSVQLRIEGASLGTSGEGGTLTPDDDQTGSTYFYTVSRKDPSAPGGWAPLCHPNWEGRIDAIPVAAIWGEHGDRVESTTDFTFACVHGVIAKCYRWGYRPWESAPSHNPNISRVKVHQTCTRAARADYCGNGDTHTLNNTPVDVYDSLQLPVTTSDTLSQPGVRASRVTAKLGDEDKYPFEAGYDEWGARCLSHWRWDNFEVVSQKLTCPIIPGSPPRGPYDGTLERHCESFADAKADTKFQVKIGISSMIETIQ
jgi:hypothetical protein